MVLPTKLWRLGILGISVGVLLVGGVILTLLLSPADDEINEIVSIQEKDRRFEIDYDNNRFLMDGKTFRYVAGSFHYFRALPQSWRRKLKTMRGAGVNAIDVYINWALHNPKDGVFNFEGIADIEKFIEIATEEGLYIILRPGPYICAEMDNGGLPYWLARKYPDIKVRTSDADYVREVSKWWSILFPKLKLHFYGNGGNIILVQIENEYGSFKACDKNYLNILKKETLKYVGDAAVLFSVDGTYLTMLACGKVDDTFSTIDFGISNRTQIDSYFANLRTVQKNGPLVNTEFYTGWLTHWQEPRSRRDGKLIADTLRILLEMEASLGFYMFYGGTNFGFWAGANEMGIGGFMADITSYDYDAPMNEAGDPTDKFWAIRDVLKDFFPVPDVSTIPAKIKKIAPPPLTVEVVGKLLSPSGRQALGRQPLFNVELLTFEQMDQFSGFLLYETVLPNMSRDPAKLVIDDLRDRAYVFVDGILKGILSRENSVKSLPLSGGKNLQLLVENQGRINFKVADDYKGIRSPVKLQTFKTDEETFEILSNWTITGFPLESYSDLEDLIHHNDSPPAIPSNGILTEGPLIFHKQFELNEIGDTWWDTTGFGKGIVFVNGFNLGRFWPLVGPQITIYIPNELLKIGQNSILIVEYQKVPKDLSVKFTDKAILDKY